MKKIVLGAILCVLGAFGNAFADTTTSRLGLTKPDIGGTGWGIKMNNNLDILDSSSTLQSGVNTFSSSATFNSSVFISSLAVTNFNTVNSTATTSVVIGSFYAKNVQVSSNTILQNATFYSGAPILVSTYVAFIPSNLGIKGTGTNDNADTGTYGEYFTSTTATSLNCAPTGNYFDLGSVTLTAGDWDIAGQCAFNQNGATATNTECGISTTAGNSSTGLSSGVNSVRGTSPSATADSGSSIPSVRQSISATTTFYLKGKCAYSAGTLQTAGSRISARRVR